MSDLEHFSVWLSDLVEKGGRLEPDQVNPKDWVNSAQFRGWTAQVEHCLIELLGAKSVYYLRFERAATITGVVYHWQRDSCFQILLSLQEDLRKGRLVSLRALVTAEVFSDFLDMSEHFLSNGYKDPSASLIGAVLERGLRDIASSNSLPIRDRDDLTALNNKLAEKGVFSRLVQKNLSVWIAVRNHADHGQFEEYSKENVMEMLSGVRNFLAQYQ